MTSDRVLPLLRATAAATSAVRELVREQGLHFVARVNP